MPSTPSVGNIPPKQSYVQSWQKCHYLHTYTYTDLPTYIPTLPTYLPTYLATYIRLGSRTENLTDAKLDKGS